MSQTTNFHGIAQKLVDYMLEQRAQLWAQELEMVAKRIGVEPDEMKRYAKPILLRLIAKYLGD